MSNLVEGRTGEWEVVIEAEVHAGIHQRKLPGAPTAFGADPNANVSLVDAAMPGMLPVINQNGPSGDPHRSWPECRDQSVQRV